MIKKQFIPFSVKQAIKCLVCSLMVAFCLTITSSAFGQTILGCNYKAGTFSMTLEGHTSGIGFTSRLVLTDSSGVIKYVTGINSITFQNVIAGNYLAYGITYQNSIYVPNLDVGRNIKLVSSCYKTVVVPTSVCDCNNSDGNIYVEQYVPPTIEYSVNYVLTDGKGTILLIKTDPYFLGNPDGVYNIIPVTYKAGMYPQNFEIGKSIQSVTGANFFKGTAKGFVVCLSQPPLLSISKSAPASAFVGDSFNYSLVISNVGRIATNGAITITDTLTQGLTFQAINASSIGRWSCQPSIIVVNNSVRTLVSCQSSDIIIPTGTQRLDFLVIAQRSGRFSNQAYVSGGGIVGRTTSNIVETIIYDKPCNEVCVPYTITKTKTKR